MEGFFFATSSGGAAAPDLNLSLEAKFDVGGVERFVTGRGILKSKGSAISEPTVDGVCRFRPLVPAYRFGRGALGEAANINRKFNSDAAIYFV